MKKSMVLLIVALFAISCTVQENKSSASAGQKQDDANNKTGIKPDIRWSVHKETDKNGNIVRYDSTYTWSYSGTNGDSALTDLDSLKYSFNQSFKKRFFTQWNQQFHMDFPDDSLNNFGKFPDDEFLKMWNDHFERMGDIFLNMDSLQSRFFKKVFPQPPDTSKSTPPKKSKFDI